MNEGVVRVVVVDDDFMVARIHRSLVDQVPGFEVVAVAHDGAAAMASVREHRPDLVLLDVHLPDVHGLILLRSLREIHEPLDVIVISAAREADTIRSALRTGIVHYLIKPFSRDHLRDALEHYRRTYMQLAQSPEARQSDVDRVFRHPQQPVDTPVRLPKNLSRETAELVARTLREAVGDVSASECARGTGLSRVSARRYLEHLVTLDQADVSLRYGPVGRPERRYRWTGR